MIYELLGLSLEHYNFLMGFTGLFCGLLVSAFVFVILKVNIS
mgnify:CR=1 FL=1